MIARTEFLRTTTPRLGVVVAASTSGSIPVWLAAIRRPSVHRSAPPGTPAEAARHRRGHGTAGGDSSRRCSAVRPSRVAVHGRPKGEGDGLRAGCVQVEDEHLLDAVVTAIRLPLEGNAPAVRRPVRIQIVSGVERQLGFISPVRVHHINIAVGVVGFGALKQDAAAIRRPVRGVANGEQREVRPVCVDDVDPLVANSVPLANASRRPFGDQSGRMLRAAG